MAELASGSQVKKITDLLNRIGILSISNQSNIMWWDMISRENVFVCMEEEEPGHITNKTFIPNTEMFERDQLDGPPNCILWVSINFLIK